MSRYKILSERFGVVGDVVTDDDLAGYNVRALVKSHMVTELPDKPKKPTKVTKKAVKAVEDDD